MKKLFIIITILLLFSVMVSAKLSEETLKEVEKLWYKHYSSFSFPLTDADALTLYSPKSIFDIEFWWSFWFEDGKLFVTTQDGKWYIEMKEVKKGDD